VLVTPFLPFPGDSKIIILLIGGYQVFITLASGLASVFIAREDAHFAGFVEFSLRAMTALAAIAAILAGGSLIITLATLPAVALWSASHFVWGSSHQVWTAQDSCVNLIANARSP
jgi:hypothetical protein